MPLDNVIADTTDLETLREEMAQDKLEQQMAAPRQPPARASLSHVVQVEKTDIQMWLDIATLVVLVLILMRL